MSWCFDEAPEGVHRFYLADKSDHKVRFVVRKGSSKIASGTASRGTKANAPSDYLEARGYRGTVTTWSRNGTSPSATVGRQQ